MSKECILSILLKGLSKSNPPLNIRHSIFYGSLFNPDAAIEAEIVVELK